MLFSRVVAVGAVGLAAGQTLGQSRFLIADRTSDALHALWDVNGNGMIDEPAEVSFFFGAGNAAGTLGLQNPTALGIRPDGLVAVGDQVNRNLTLLRDLNRDGDALDVGESWVAADASNASGAVLSFPACAAFDLAGALYVVNAGSTLGADGMYRFQDLTFDGDYQDIGEITVFIGEPVFGPGNGPYSPQEVVFLPTQGQVSGYLRNSSAGLHGVFRFADLNADGRADGAGEFAAFFDAANQSGVTLSAGFAVELDAARPGAVYMHQVATGSADQIYRVIDGNSDGDANDAGEAVLVFSTVESGFTSVDILSKTDGRVLMTDNSGKRVIALTDLDNDGLFTGAGERADFFANSMLLAGDVRQIAALAVVCQGNCDESTAAPVLNVADFTCFLQRYAAGDLYANCDSSTQTPVLNVADFTCFLERYAAGCL
jgi:hypothetical protein